MASIPVLYFEPICDLVASEFHLYFSETHSGEWHSGPNVCL